MIVVNNQLGEARDLKEERDDEEFSAMYEQVKAERQEAGLRDAPIMVCAETMKRLRIKNGK